MLAGEMGQTWETWGQDPFLPELQTPPEPEGPSFQGLEVIGRFLWCLLGAFVPGDFFDSTVPKDVSVLLPSGSGRVGARKCHAHGMLPLHQLFL